MKIKLTVMILFFMILTPACSANSQGVLTSTPTATVVDTLAPSSTPTVNTPVPILPTDTPTPQVTPVAAEQSVSLAGPQFDTIPLGQSVLLTNEGDVSYTFRVKAVYIGERAASKILKAQPAEELQLVVVIPEIIYKHGPANKRVQLMQEDSFRIISKGHVLENDFIKYTPVSNHINHITLLPGETSQGYLVFAIYKDDSHPVLRYVNQDKTYFFDLAQPAPPVAPLEITLSQFDSNGFGNAGQPVPLGKSVLYDWHGTTLLLTVEGMERGAEAIKRLWNIGKVNPIPGSGQEYILPYLHIQVVKSPGGVTVIDPMLFKIVNQGKVVDNASLLACPMSCLTHINLYQGGEALGWLPLITSKSDSQPVLEFNQDLFMSLTGANASQNAEETQSVPPTFPADAIGYATIKNVGKTIELQQHSPVNSLAFSPDNSLLASASDDHKIHIWDVSKGVEIKTLEKHRAGVKYVSFSVDGKWMVSVSHDEEIIVWNVADWQIVQELKQGGNGIFGEFLADGTLISVNEAGMITYWDTSSGKTIKKSMAQKNINDACSRSILYDFDMTPDGMIFAAALACGYGVVWNAITGTRLVTDLNHAVDSGQIPYTAAISLAHAGGLAAYGGSYYESGDYLLDIADTDRQLVLGGVGTGTVNIPAIAFSPNGQVVAAAIGPVVRTWWPNGYVWNGRGSLDLKGNTAQVTAIKFSSDATWLASGDYNGHIILWKVNPK